ncbi:PE-PGRS family protein [Streptomyces sp. NPDC101227]|uniref:WXG100-like domain-containing protein n=1 Tax=Streptomyces sp. NPDC101227 TaxID=3366136 RepID=UPI0038040C35
MLPDALVEVLSLIGYEWPNADEDKLFECASTWRTFAEQCNQTLSDGTTAANEVVGANSGDAIEGFSKEWGAYAGTGGSGDHYLRDAAAAAEVIAAAFDAAAIAVIAGKIAVIAQLIALAIELIAAQAAAPFTLGLSELGAAGATQAARVIVRQILEKLKREVMQAATKAMEHATMDAIKKMAKNVVSKEARKLAMDAAKKAVGKEARQAAMDYVKTTVKDEVKKTVVDAAKDSAREFVTDTVVQGAKDKAAEAGEEMAGNLVGQGIENHFGARDGIDLGETADIAKEKAGEYVDDVKKDAEDRINDYKDGVTSLADPQHWVDRAKDDAANAAEHHTNRGLDAAQRHVDRHTGGAATRHQDVTDEGRNAVTEHVRSVFG